MTAAVMGDLLNGRFSVNIKCIILFTLNNLLIIYIFLNCAALLSVPTNSIPSYGSYSGLFSVRWRTACCHGDGMTLWCIVGIVVLWVDQIVVFASFMSVLVPCGWLWDSCS